MPLRLCLPERPVFGQEFNKRGKAGSPYGLPAFYFEKYGAWQEKSIVTYKYDNYIYKKLHYILTHANRPIIRVIRRFLP